ncbi:LexA family transcriptional regulator [Humisphaera borealis]|uniref:LexA family transcriptional regulator n=2 Tax=Humisphaera borealis TaxID=2807512 RepID=A0A7M2WQQ1_9BACT|nr:LexA family transcriptional regulator [Humisphaera borealis]
MTLDELARSAGISKAYLSLIETGRVTNPPSDEKLRRIEQALNFPANELVSQANLQRTPRDVRAVLQQLIRQRSGIENGPGRATDASPAAGSRSGPLNLDDAYLSGVLQELADRSTSNIESVSLGTAVASGAGMASSVSSPAVPVVNRVSAGYPSDFTDLSYPPRNADAYITAPGVNDPDAFAARVSGDSMSPKYTEGDIVIFSPAAAWKDGADCFVRFDDGQTTFKRVYTHRGDDGHESLRLEPRNARYPARTVPREQVEGVYRAVFCYRTVEEE